MFENAITTDDLMEEFIKDYVVADEELSDSIFTCIDNYIDSLCIDVMKDENSIYEDDAEGDVPFTYILDKVMERIDTLEKVQDDAMDNASKIDLEYINSFDPDYISPDELGELNPEEFQLFINDDFQQNEDDTLEDGYEQRSLYNDSFTDANYNA